MASKASPEASEVRRRGQRRLIGAVAIVLLLVVFVPMVLDDEPRSTSTGPDTSIPPRDKAPPLPPPAAPSQPASSATVAPSPAMKAATPNPAKPAGVPSEASQAPREAAAAAAEAQVAVVEPDAVKKKAEVLKAEVLKQSELPAKAGGKEPPPSPKAEGEAAARPPAKGEAEKAPRLEGFAIQVGAFREEDRVKAVREKLAGAGVVHYTERLDSPGGPITRLRAGPFPSRAAADAAMGKIKAVAPDAKVVPLP